MAAGRAVTIEGRGNRCVGSATRIAEAKVVTDVGARFDPRSKGYEVVFGILFASGWVRVKTGGKHF